MRVPEGEHQVVALLGGAVADPDEVELADEALADPLDHVRDQGPGQPVERAMGGGVAGTLDDDRRVLDADHHRRRQQPLEGATPALDRQVAAGEGDVDPGGDGDGEAADARHLSSPHVGHHLAAEAGALGGASGHQALGGGDQ